MIEITIPTAEQGIGGQSGAGGTISALAVQLYDHSGNTANIPNGSLEVFVTGGTVNSTVNFSGSISTDIGNVKIEDANDNYAVMPPVGTPKTNATCALVVTAIDETGATLRQSTQVALLNSQGTQATSSNQITQNAYLLTLVTNQANQATSALQTAGNAALAAVVNELGTIATESTLRSVRDGVMTIYNNQGTAASEESLEDIEATLVAIMNNQGTLTPVSPTDRATATGVAVVANNQGTQATSALQTTGNNSLALIANNLGTLTPLPTTGLATAAGVAAVVNNQGTQATETTLGRVSATLTAIMNSQGTLVDSSESKLLGIVMNNQGTQATAALQTTAIAVATVIMNEMGTLATAAGQGSTTATVTMNNQGTQATSALQTAGNNSLAVIVNDFGTVATAAAQAAQNTTLTAILNNQGTQSAATIVAPLTVVMNNQGTQATTAAQAAGNNTLTAILNAQGTQSSASVVTALSVVSNNQGTQATSANQVTSNAYLLTLSTNSAGAATAANQVATTNQLASIVRTYGASGTAATASNSVLMALDPSAASTDAFGRLRVSNPDFRLDAQLTYDVSADLWDNVWNSSGTVTYDTTNRMAVVTCAANGTSVLQTHKYAPYTPGRSQLALMTFILGSTPPYNTARRVGYYDSVTANGIYLEQTPYTLNLVLASTTSNGNQVIPQSSWNIDKLNGSGPSGITLDPTKVQILAVSLQALYAGRVVVGFDIDGILWPVHAFTHANKIAYPYIANASLPVHFESRSTGSNTVSMSGLCASVMSEGGGNLAEIPTRTFSAARSSLLTLSARVPVLSIRPNKYYDGQRNTALMLPSTFSGYSSGQAIYLEIVRNATTLTNASWTNVDNLSDTVAQYDTSATAISGGAVVFSSFVGSGGAGAGAIPISPNLLDRLVLAYSHLEDAADTLTVVATSVAGNTNVGVAVVWKEVR